MNDTTSIFARGRTLGRRRKAAVGAVVGAALLGAGLAACGSSSSSPATSTTPGGTSSSEAGSTGASGATTLKTSTNPALGTILVTSSGATVYRFDADTTSPPTSHCSGGCASAWPPVLVGSANPTAQGVPQSEVGSITRADGGKQITVDGSPLYTYTGDSAPGQANGQGVNAFGASWFAVTPNGARATASPGASSSASTGVYP